MDLTYGPDATVTRGRMAVFIAKALGRPFPTGLYLGID